MKKVLLVVGFVLLLLFLGKVGYEFYQGFSRHLGLSLDTIRPAPPSGLTRTYPITIKGVIISTPGSEMATLKRATEEMKNLGINTIQIIIAGKKSRDGRFYPHIGPLGGNILLNYYKNVIVEAKKRGFAVWISYDVDSGGVNWPWNYTFTNRKAWEQDMVASAIEFAKIFEEYRVEYYSPVVELDLVLEKNNLTGEPLNTSLRTLAQAIYPQVRRVFNGKIIAKVTEGRPLVGAKESEAAWTAEAQGADMIALDFGDPYVDNYRTSLQTKLSAVISTRRKLGIPWAIGEYFQGDLGTGKLWDIQALSLAFEEITKQTPPAAGVSFNFWEHLEGEQNKAVKEAFKEFYSKF